MGQHAGANARPGGATASCRDRETDAAGAFQYNTAPALSAISSSMQCNTCNAMKAKNSINGQ